MIPGLIASALAASGKLDLSQADQAFPALVQTLLPAGLRGLVAGGLLAALMSSLAAIFNSCSTLFTMDVYQKLQPDANQKQLVRVGRLATAVVVVLGILWIPVMEGISGVLYEYLQSVQSYLAPPIAAVFLLGIFSKRITGKGALFTLLIGFLLGGLRIVLELYKTSLDGWLYDFATLNFLYFCILLFVFCVLLLITASLLTKKPSEEKLRGLTYATTVAEDRAASRASWNKWDLILSLTLFLFIIAVFLYFSPLGVAGE